MKPFPFPELPASGVTTVIQPESVESGAAAKTCKTGIVQGPGRLYDQTPHPKRRSLKSSVLSFNNFHSHGTLFIDFLRARKDVFIEQKKWSIPSFGEFEFDQYDTPASHWIVVHEYGEVLAGIRLTPTTARCGMYSYMIRDAQLGLIKEIPRDVIFFPAPRRRNVLEASRIFVTRDVRACRRLEVHTFLFDEFQATARMLGASHALGIVPKAWRRWFRRLGKKAVPAGPTMRIGYEDCQSVIFNVKSSGLESSRLPSGMPFEGLESDLGSGKPLSPAA